LDTNVDPFTFAPYYLIQDSLNQVDLNCKNVIRI